MYARWVIRDLQKIQSWQWRLQLVTGFDGSCFWRRSDGLMVIFVPFKGEIWRPCKHQVLHLKPVCHSIQKQNSENQNPRVAVISLQLSNPGINLFHHWTQAQQTQSPQCFPPQRMPIGSPRLAVMVDLPSLQDESGVDWRKMVSKFWYNGNLEQKEAGLCLQQKVPRMLPNSSYSGQKGGFSSDLMSKIKIRIWLPTSNLSNSCWIWVSQESRPCFCRISRVSGASSPIGFNNKTWPDTYDSEMRMMKVHHDSSPMNKWKLELQKEKLGRFNPRKQLCTYLSPKLTWSGTKPKRCFKASNCSADSGKPCCTGSLVSSAYIVCWDPKHNCIRCLLGVIDPDAGFGFANLLPSKYLFGMYIQICRLWVNLATVVKRWELKRCDEDLP